MCGGGGDGGLGMPGSGRPTIMVGGWIASLLALAGYSPLLQAVAIGFATFVLEDAATVPAAMQAAQGETSVGLALASLFVGIVQGDLGLYGLGRLSARVPWIAGLLPPHRKAATRAWLTGRVFQVVLVSRFLPGLRLPTYTTCGFLGADLRQFTLAAVVATMCWTSLLFGASLEVRQVLLDHFGAWRWLGAAGFVLFVIVAWRLAAAGVQGVRR
jgi:membrane protein DedA with SNARE-associated domain